MCSECQKMFSPNRKGVEAAKVRREATGEGRQNVSTNSLARFCVGGKASFNCMIPDQSAFVTPGIAHG